ncbi:protein FAM185A [Cephus cinctus]|uniref:Protein FAM185A n=1 Tax=Cephus cinctus TaxID=211228 RepID=A0AAJ7CEG6_CEPCN|nr:protein FAM185A [Cephus cinctus]XP_015608554.1 protein FAM185A [Cephus cinctus]
MNTVCGRCFLSYLRFNQTFYNALPALVTHSRWFSSNKPIVVQEIVKTVKPFGKVVINVACDVEVKSTDPDMYPDMNTVLIRLLSKEALPDSEGEVLTVHVNDDICEIRTLDEQLHLIPDDAKCLIESPVRYDVDVQAIGNCNVHVSGMVSDSIIVQTECGDITGGKLQAGQLILSSSDGGSVKLCHSLQGNIEINTAKNGLVQADKILGAELKVSTQNGDVQVGSNYCTKSTFTTENGNLHLNNLHMNSTVDIDGSGSLHITCLDGSLQADLKEGLAKIQVVRLTGDSRISSNGEIILIIPEVNEVQLKLKAQKLEVDGNINGMEEHSREMQRFRSLGGQVTFEAMTTKSIKVNRASWAKTLNLGRFMQ